MNVSDLVRTYLDGKLYTLAALEIGVIITARFPG